MGVWLNVWLKIDLKDIYCLSVVTIFVHLIKRHSVGHTQQASLVLLIVNFIYLAHFT